MVQLIAAGTSAARYVVFITTQVFATTKIFWEEARSGLLGTGQETQQDKLIAAARVKGIYSQPIFDSLALEFETSVDNLFQKVLDFPESRSKKRYSEANSRSRE